VRKEINESGKLNPQWRHIIKTGARSCNIAARKLMEASAAINYRRPQRNAPVQKIFYPAPPLVLWHFVLRGAGESEIEYQRVFPSSQSNYQITRRRVCTP